MNSISRHETKEELMGLCSPLEAFGLYVCVCVYTSVFVLILQSTLRAEVTEEKRSKGWNQERTYGIMSAI